MFPRTACLHHNTIEGRSGLHGPNNPPSADGLLDPRTPRLLRLGEFDT